MKWETKTIYVGYDTYFMTMFECIVCLVIGWMDHYQQCSSIFFHDL